MKAAWWRPWLKKLRLGLYSMGKMEEVQACWEVAHESWWRTKEALQAWRTKRTGSMQDKSAGGLTGILKRLSK